MVLEHLLQHLHSLNQPLWNNHAHEFTSKNILLTEFTQAILEYVYVWMTLQQQWNWVEQMQVVWCNFDENTYIKVSWIFLIISQPFIAHPKLSFWAALNPVPSLSQVNVQYRSATAAQKLENEANCKVKRLSGTHTIGFNICKPRSTT